MKRIIKPAITVFLVAVLIAAFSDRSSGQILDPRAWKKENVKNRIPITWTYLREADVMWAKRIWRIVDMREKINLPLYYPLTPIYDRVSLFDVLYQAMMSGTDNFPPHPKNYDPLTAYKSDEFDEPYTPQEVAFAAYIRFTTTSYDADGNKTTSIDSMPVQTKDVTQYMLMEDWFFDRNRSVMDVRIIGIAPIYYGYQMDENGEKTMKPDPTMMCYFYFPEARWFFAEKEVFNRQNDAERRSYDDVFWKRIFGSYIFKEENVFDRTIKEYAIGMDALLEAERIKYELFKIEHDLWEY
ncbi:MAG: gliding motility protein GldN [Bacteroidetes bacterium]|nr:gliding motility protein GldN [Bacteroidota bacterium]MBU1717706.1 gliding motility protein GldN [Bacteroidota bacterium]